MGQVNTKLLPLFRFACVRPNVDLGALGFVHTNAGISEVDWIGHTASRSFEESRAAASRMRSYVHGVLERIRKYAGLCPLDAKAEAVVSSFGAFGNSRVMLALKQEAVLEHAEQTLLWSDLYRRAAYRNHDLDKQQRKEFKLLVPRLEQRVKETVDFIRAPVRADTDVHSLFVSVASLGLINQETMCLVGKALQRSMLKALSNLSKNANVYLRQAAAISLVRQAVSLRGMTPMISDAARGWARAMRYVAKMPGIGDPECDRGSMMESLLEHSVLLTPHVGRQDIQIMVEVILSVRNDGDETEHLRVIAGQIFQEMR